jgi:elongator complex protein 4
MLYPPHASDPRHLLSFLHALRALLRQYSTFTILLSYPLALYPRHNPLTRWTEHLCDGIIQLQPFPHAYSTDASPSSSSSSKGEEKMQGLLKVLKVPVLSERGVGVGGGEDMAFAVGRRKFDIRPFHLPPMEGEEEGGGAGSDAKALEF